MNILKEVRVINPAGWSLEDFEVKIKEFQEFADDSIMFILSRYDLQTSIENTGEGSILSVVIPPEMPNSEKGELAAEFFNICQHYDNLSVKLIDDDENTSLMDLVP
jgi:hypothetical protein